MISIGIGWLIIMGKFNLIMSHVRKRGNIGLNQSLIYTNPCTPLSTNFFYLPPLHLSSQKKGMFFGKNIFGGAFPLPQITPMQMGTSKQVLPFCCII
jgi:hypothetical protein